MTQKKYSFHLVCCLFGIFLAANLAEAAARPVPPLENMGVLPIKWSEDDWRDFEDTKPLFEETFYSVVKSSYRFRFINDDLVKSLWVTPQGREELITEHGLNGFLLLKVEKTDDSVIWTARCLDEKLTVLLSESDSFSIDWFLNRAGPKGLRAKMEALSYRLLNQLPFDLRIRSLQGTFVTLVGGSSIGVQKGMDFPVFRFAVTNLHPSSGAWVKYDKDKQGSIRIVEVKTSSSIGEITEEIKPGAIQVGDGMKLQDSPSRALFAQLASKDAFVDTRTVQEKGGLVKAYPLTKPQSSPKPAPLKKAEVAAEESPKVDRSPEEPKTEEHVPPPREQMVPPRHNANVTGKDILEINGGLHLWNVRGPVSDGARFPTWLLNKLGARLERRMSDGMFWRYGGSLKFGTSKEGGSFTGLGGYMAVGWELPLPSSLGVRDYVSSWNWGLFADAETLNLSNSSLGGRDMLRGGAFLNFGDEFSLPEVPERILWNVETYLSPLALGRFGYDGGFKNIDSSFSYGLMFRGLYGPVQPGSIQWGGFLGWENDRYYMTNGERLTQSAMLLGAMGRVVL